MRSALAELPGVDAEDITLDTTAKTATIALSDVAAPSEKDLAKVFEGTKYSAKIQN